MGLQAEISDALALKLRSFPELTDTEIDFLNSVRSDKRSINAEVDLIAEGQSLERAIILEEGWCYRHSILSNGNRQIVNFFLPGDMIGFWASWIHSAEYSVRTLTDSVVSYVEPEVVLNLFQSCPRLAIALSWFAAQEESLLVQQIVRLGRRNAYQRLAHFLLVLLRRLQAIDQAGSRSFELPLTQEMLADTLGLTVVHINRTLRKMRRENLIEMDHRRIVLKNIPILEEIAEYGQKLIFQRSIPLETKAQLVAMDDGSEYKE